MAARYWSTVDQRYVTWSDMEDLAAAEALALSMAQQTAPTSEAMPARCNSHFGAFQTICLDATWCGLQGECERLWRRELVIYAARLAVKQMRGR